ncbi:ABC transporter substrate-binding protein [Streptomyces capillispiralis]|uniref:Uncharacterized protein n=1 Tax=Streptomyces capillispiralis TaxID=68182 RepID=A0A561TEW7_9ACTN|nr:ABC transporter substrate-binding protein [Streptomyces capillispiralis]TWF85652.1 hypothetical protein FHX78_112604 [Streptomyces capillispiralis]GHH89933.1 hypothetical protein GCM10017779_03900 [Streptomyces capillispiralis]
MALRRSGTEVWRDAVPSAAGRLVLDLCGNLIDGYARRRGPMPVVVVHAARENAGADDDRVPEIVDLVHRAHRPRWLLLRRPAPSAGPEEGADGPAGGPGDPAHGAGRPVPVLDDRTFTAATALVKDVAEGDWENHNRCQYRPYRMPRSLLMAALDQALADTTDGAGGAPDPRAVVARLAELRWRPRPARAPAGFWRSMAALLSPATALGAAIVACVSALAGNVGSPALTAATLGVLLVVATGYGVRRWAGPPWLGPGCRWFATTTFPVHSNSEAPVWSPWHPRLSRATLEDRAAEVVGQLITASGTPSGPAHDAAAVAAEREQARQFCLQLRTLALLEDLRDNHRPAWDLRHRKRTVPPLLLIPRATWASGALPVLRAISDVRSRRSEQDPLLVVAGVSHRDLADLRDPTPLPLPVLSASGSGRELDPLYRAWVTRSLRTGQAPSVNTALPWVLPVPVSSVGPTDCGHPAHTGEQRSTHRVPRSPWLLWSRWTLVATCLLGTTGGALHYQTLKERYCGMGGSVVWDRDLVRTVGGQCVGVVSETDWRPSRDAVLLDASGRAVGAEGLLKAIDEANRRIDPDEEHITLVFAGALSTRAQNRAEAVDVVRQLAGVYLAQHLVNDSQQSNRLPRLRIEIANGGQGMEHQGEMAERIVAFARREPTVVGVVGMGIHTPGSAGAMEQLQRAGLAVIGTTNSATGLARDHRNYVGMAPTDHEQATLLVTSLGAAAGRRAAVLRPEGTGGSGHSYTHDQAKYGHEALSAAGFDVRGPFEYPVEGTSAQLHETAGRICDSGIDVVYLAGRAGYIPSLMTELSTHASCTERSAHRVTVLVGDEASKKSFQDATMPFPAGARLDYTSLTYEEYPRTAQLYDRAAEVFRSGFDRVARPGDTGPSLYADGFLALSHDATTAFHTIAQEAGVPARGGAPVVLAALHSIEFQGSTGYISFRNADAVRPDRRGHGIGRYEVTGSGEGARLRVTGPCGRPAGGSVPLTRVCAQGKEPEASSSSPAGTP